MKILITGKNGQLGKSINKIIDEKSNVNLFNNDFIFTGREELDLENIESIKSFFRVNEFDIIINCAAYTKVDEAEKNKKQANLINHLAVKELAKIAYHKNVKLIHISTDFVFNGLKKKPYTENDAKSPLNIYGETKLAGELAVMSNMKSNSIIIRTSWVYSEFGSNFLKTILNLSKNNSNLNIISDQIGTPTYASDLAQTILNIISNKQFIESDKPSEIFHYSNNGETSWYEFAKEIISIYGINCQVNPINTEAFPLPAKRPKYSILSKKKISQNFSINIRHWKDALQACMKNI